MRTEYELYVDSDGVTRGYYVYLHRDLATSEVFYIGKGSGRRAWDTEGRHDLWKQKVVSLAAGWDVEVAKHDLSEIEAFELEAELVELHGGCAAVGGKLTNWIPGGEDPVSIRLELRLDDGGWGQAYQEARIFKEFPRAEKQDMVGSLKKGLDSIVKELVHLERHAHETGDEHLADSISDVDVLVRSLLDAAANFLRRRESWKDLGLALEDACDSLASELEGIAKHHDKVKPLLMQSHALTSKLLSAIDSGNKQEAEDTATRVRRRGENSPPPASLGNREIDAP
jgi:hypothetical protein